MKKRSLKKKKMAVCFIKHTGCFVLVVMVLRRNSYHKASQTTLFLLLSPYKQIVEKLTDF